MLIHYSIAEGTFVVGARTVEHLRNNLVAAELTLDNEAPEPTETLDAFADTEYWLNEDSFC